MSAEVFAPYLEVTLRGASDRAGSARLVLGRSAHHTGSGHVASLMTLDKRLLCFNNSSMPVEVQVYLAKWVPDPRRKEPRNFGLCVVAGTGRFHYRFLPESPEGADSEEYLGVVRKWSESLQKYGQQALKWVGKQRGPYYIEFAHGEMVQTLDFDKLYEELVL